jgi:hypothetical protein
MTTQPVPDVPEPEQPAPDEQPEPDATGEDDEQE